MRFIQTFAALLVSLCLVGCVYHDKGTATRNDTETITNRPDGVTTVRTTTEKYDRSGFGFPYSVDGRTNPPQGGYGSDFRYGNHPSMYRARALPVFKQPWRFVRYFNSGRKTPHLAVLIHDQTGKNKIIPVDELNTYNIINRGDIPPLE